MSLKRLRLVSAIVLFILLSGKLNAQSCINTGINGTVINLACNQTCSTLVFQVPHIKSTEDYTLVTIPYNPFPYSTGSGTPVPGLDIDDTYSPVITLPFSFCFYGNNYSGAVVGSNGLLTFETAVAGCKNAYIIDHTIPWAGSFACGSISPSYYPRAAIMPAFLDLDPELPHGYSPPDRKIQYEIFGTAPCRTFVVSFYHVGVYGVNYNSCGTPSWNTFQMVLHESTGLIEYYYERKQCQSTTNPPGKGVFGIQNWLRDKYVTDPAKNNTYWTEDHSGYRFIPSGNTSLFVISELLDMSGNVVATADTTTTTPGLLDLRFLNFCAPAGNNQYVVRTKFSSCDNPFNYLISLDTIGINRTNSLNATASSTAASCGPPNGTITVSVPAGVGTPPYTFTLDGGTPVTAPSPYTFNNVSSGPHTITVTDASGGCTSTINVNVTLNGTISETHNTTPTACFGVNNGQITITSATGIGPYSFSLDGGAPQAGTLPYTFSNLAAGNHTIIVYDAGTGCNTGSVTITVAVGPGVSGTATTTPTACVGASTGSITVTATSGTAPFTWSLDGGAPQNGTSPYTFNNVSAGAHTVTIRDNFNCSILVPVNVANGPGVSGTATSIPTSCPTATNGSITVTATSGTAPFTWDLDGGGPQNGSSPYTFNNVAAGAHTVVITDVNGCNILVPVTVTAGNALTATTTSTQTACASATNGSITITGANGTAPYTFSLDGGAPQAGSIPYTFNNVASGNHTIIVVDATGCSSAPITVTVAAGPGVSGNATTNATSCPAAANGSITVTATAGTAPFTWALDGGAPQNGASPYTFNNVAAGSHTIVITDNFGCSLTLSNVVVSAGPGLTVNTSATSTSCVGANNGSITVTPMNGTAPFTFSLDGGAPVNGTPPYTFNNLAAGPHTIVVTDGAGCVSNTINETVPSGPNITATVTPADVLCNGGATRTITVSPPTPGIPPFSYSLDGINWQPGGTFNGLVAGTYTVYFRENAGCQGSQSVTISEPPVLTASAATVPVVCNGASNGTITITASGGFGTYQYSIDNGANWQGSNIFNVPAGSYTILIRDANNCTTTQNVTVTEPAALTASTATTAASCDGGNDGTITVTANGGNSNYQYSLDGVNFQSNNVFNVAPGTYTVTITDNLGCSTTTPATVALGSNLTYTNQPDATICEGTSTQLQFNSNATVYSWTPSSGLSNTGIPNPVANPTVTTTYYVTATLQRCSVIDTVKVIVNPAPVPDAGAPGVICFGQTYQLQGSGGVLYSWTPSTYLDNPNIANPISTPAKTIFYTLSILADNNGCKSLVTDSVMVDVTPPIKINTFPYDTIAYAGEQIQLLAVSVVPAANVYVWTPSTDLSNPNIPNPVFTGGNVGDVRLYRVTASSAAGCMGEGFVRVRVYKGPELYVPTAFTPNGDGLNDTFYPFPVGIKSINYFKVFNRWGQLVFSSTTLYKGWDGKMSSTSQPTGVYVWMAEAVDKNGNLLTRKGTVTLIR